MRTARLLASLAAVLLALLDVRTASAADPDAGTPPVPAQTSDGGPSTTPSADASPSGSGASSEPPVRLPATAAEQAEGLPIASLEVTGNRRVAREDVLSYLREKVGHLFAVDALTSDVHALWDSGFFEDIQVD